MVHTSIHVDPSVRKEFNAFVENLTSQFQNSEEEIPAYFDAGYMEGGERALDWFLRNPMTTKVAYLYTNWRINRDGLLYDCSEKFHGSVSLLQYCIDHFFAPRNILLNGAIIGVNTEYAIVFAYRVTDNVIMLDEEVTRTFLKIYRLLEKTYEETGEYRKIVDDTVRMMCHRMNISEPN